MCLKFLVLGLLCLMISGLTAQRIKIVKEKLLNDQKVAASAINTYIDPLETSESHYFQDVYVAKKNPKELEFGHVFENPKEWEQRFEKINLENLNRQGKVRWGDKHGGYGEHLWDYNHAGHHHDHHDKDHHHHHHEADDDDDGGEESQRSEIYLPRHHQQQQSQNIQKSSSDHHHRAKRNPDEDVEFVNDEAKSTILNDKTPKHGGNYRRAKETRHKRQPLPSDLAFDETSGLIIDESTGIKYKLKEVPSDSNNN